MLKCLRAYVSRETIGWGDPLPILLKDGGWGSSLIIIEDVVEAGEVAQTIFCVILKLYYNIGCATFF